MSGVAGLGGRNWILFTFAWDRSQSEFFIVFFQSPNFQEHVVKLGQLLVARFFNDACLQAVICRQVLHDLSCGVVLIQLAQIQVVV